MPVVPLYSPAQTPDAWHRVTAPGGYEWWYFDAEDAGGRLRVVAILLEGFVFHPGYLRRYARYRRDPTRHRPPQPGEYPCAYLAVYDGDRVLGQFMTQYPPGALNASPDRPEVRLGPNGFRTGDSGELRLTLRGEPWQLTWRGPRLLAGQSLTAELTFHPLLNHPAHERRFFSLALTGAEHHWVLANPLCEVRGALSLSGPAGSWSAPFDGRGYHDHNYGTAPVGPGLRRWLWGRVLLGDRVSTFHLAVPTDPGLPDEFHLVEADAGGVREVRRDEAPSVHWGRRTGTLLPYPTTLDFGGGLFLHHPRVIDASPFYLRLLYETPYFGREATAFCEVAYPHRLRWPVLGRMSEMSINRAEGVAPAPT